MLFDILWAGPDRRVRSALVSGRAVCVLWALLSFSWRHAACRTFFFSCWSPGPAALLLELDGVCLSVYLAVLLSAVSSVLLCEPKSYSE